MCARLMEAEADREGLVREYDPGVAQNWATKSAGGSGPAVASYELGSLPPPPKFVETKAKKNSFMGIRGIQQVPVNLSVPGGYATRV